MREIRHLRDELAGGREEKAQAIFDNPQKQKAFLTLIDAVSAAAHVDPDSP